MAILIMLHSYKIMLSSTAQANNVWWIYNQQENYNNQLINWRILLLHYFRYRWWKYTIDSHKYGNYKHQEQILINDLIHALNKESSKMKKFLADHLRITYKKMWKQGNKNIDENSPLPPEDEINRIVHEIWVGNKNFEERQDDNTGKISDKIKRIVNDEHFSLEQKKTEIEKALTSYYNMNHRLLRTETIHIINQSNMDCMKHGGIDRVMWITAEDERVCVHCRPRDHKVYPIDLVPPYPDHPNCRCVLIGVSKLVTKSEIH